MKPSSLLFGTAGIPFSTNPRNTVEGVKRVGALGLGSMELEFVRNVNVSKEKAPEVKKAAIESNVILTAHGSYFINLNAVDPEKIGASRMRVIQAAQRLHECGGWSMTFHPAYYLKSTTNATYTQVKKQLQKIVKQLQDEGNTVWIRPETTGKGTQFGDIDELLTLSQKVEQVMPCVDFSHLHARSNGKYNTTEEFIVVLEKIEKALGKEGLENMHIHLSGINYGPKGERNHLMLDDSDMNYEELLKVWKQFKIKGAVTCESPNPEPDALMLQKRYAKL